MTAAARTGAEQRLDFADRARLVCEIAAAYARARVCLRRLGLRGALEALRSAPEGPQRAGADSVETGRRLGRAVVRTLAVLPADSRCLMRSLVLTALLARRGIPSELVIAVRPGESFAAHAWVEHEGMALLPPGAPAFAPLVAL